MSEPFEPPDPAEPESVDERFDRERLGRRVAAHRGKLGWTQQELADRVGVTRQTVVSIEKGNYSPSVALALALAEVFGVRVEDLFQLGGDGDD